MLVLVPFGLRAMRALRRAFLGFHRKMSLNLRKGSYVECFAKHRPLNGPGIEQARYMVLGLSPSTSQALNLAEGCSMFIRLCYI